MVQEAVSYLQKNCQNQNCKTSPSLPVHRLVSLFPYRPTCVWIPNHGYELLPYSPPFLLPCPHAHGSLLFCSGQTDCSRTLTGGKQSENPGPAGLLHSQPSAGREEAPASPQLLLAIRVLLAVDLSTAALWLPQLCRAGAGHHVPSEGCDCVLLVTHQEVTKGPDPEHWETLPALCKWEKKEEGSSVVAFFYGDQCWVKERAPGLEGGKLKSLEK